MGNIVNCNKIIEDLFGVENPDVNTLISSNDGMYNRKANYAWEHYFSVGISALMNINLSMVAAGTSGTEIKNLLDFACGHGRVLRMLRAAFPHAVVTACDLNKDGVDFCSNVLGSIPVYAEHGKGNMPRFNNKFDLIWNGSMLTHLNHDIWKDYLNYFKSLLNPGGIIVFSTHGPEVSNWLKNGKWNYDLDQKGIKTLIKEYNRSGFGYVNYQGSSNYGVSLVKPSRVLSLIEEIPGFRILTYTEKSWDNHHDIVSLVKED